MSTLKELAFEYKHAATKLAMAIERHKVAGDLSEAELKSLRQVLRENREMEAAHLLSGYQTLQDITVGVQLDGRIKRNRWKHPNAAFPQRLQTLREKCRLSRRTLAELCGLSKNMISLYERGEKAPSVDALINLANFFEVPIDYLLGRKKF